MTLPNAISLMRVLLVPVIIWALLSGHTMAAFLLFLLAGISDAVDGILARALNQHSDVGELLDPLADKTLLVAVFIVLAQLGHMPLWLVILVVSRDVLIIAGILVAHVLGRPMKIRPLWVSKANTAAQIVLVLYILAGLAYGHIDPTIARLLEWAAGILTGLSAIAYMFQGIQHLASDQDADMGDRSRQNG